MMSAQKTNRRGFLKSVGLAAGSLGASRAFSSTGFTAAPGGVPGAGTDGGFRLGLASYTFRAFGLDETLAMTRRLNLKRVCFKSYHLPLESSAAEIAEIAAKTKSAGLELYAAGVIYMTTEAEVNHAFDYARAAGLEMIIGVPNWELLDGTEANIRRTGISLAIHNHGPTDKLYPTPQSAYDRIRGRDPRLGLCLDVGHTQRCGLDPSESAERFFDRIIDVHIKDVSAATAQGDTVEAGRGVVDIPQILRTLLRLRYAGTVGMEFEKDEKDPLPGVAESLGYVRGCLAALGAGRP